jgi:hypothetical protein
VSLRPSTNKAEDELSKIIIIWHREQLKTVIKSHYKILDFPVVFQKIDSAS